MAIAPPGERFNPLGKFIDAGVFVTISSDAPVAEPLPLKAVQAAATRVTRQGHKLGGDELLITAAQGLAAHTINATRAMGREDDLGSLESGKRADFAVLSGNPLAVDPGAIAAIRVLQTWVGGTCHYTADPLPTVEKEFEHV